MGRNAEDLGLTGFGRAGRLVAREGKAVALRGELARTPFADYRLIQGPCNPLTVAWF